MRFLSSGRIAVVLALFATMAVVSPALGGPSLQSMVRDEVAKQLASTAKKKKKKAKPGPAGPQGPAGPAGAAGSARAYAKVNSHAGSPCTGGAGTNCAFSSSKGVAQVVRLAAGRYCVFATGISGSLATAAVSVADAGTTFPASDAIAYLGDSCNTGDGSAFEVKTMRSGVAADNVGFTIVIP